MNGLPPCLLDRICANLPRRDVPAVARASRDWREAALRVDEPAARCVDASLSVDEYLRTREDAEWAIANGCPLTTKTFERAAAGGNVEVMRALRANGCPHDSRACAAAAVRGNLEALRWMMERGFGRNFLTCSAAVYSRAEGAKEVVRWLSRLKNCPCGGTYH